MKEKINLGCESSFPYDICHKENQSRNSFLLSLHKTSALSDLIHMDVWGSYKVFTIIGFEYFLTIVDYWNRGVDVYMMNSKLRFFYWFFVFHSILKNHFNSCVKIVMSNNGSELVNNQFKACLIKML